ncbi:MULTISPECIES: putative 2OG-Fe(II) oxygenase [unclassified Novosphingobium]|uniref:putative 2OG-Fe(II) oxygenase n=1 Tax=unclassified Novosphingobium TaxID=2644732 RepID=UPI0025FC4755|nr:MULTISPECIES: putative 2OG-Fe(II) oxygenase [unclassified Novosphingobium]HQV02278.1 putative 2OG-Fe(II) oxygenase [Novosphingobium sp.]
MSAQFDLKVESAKRLNARQEVLLAREALARNPDSALMRARLAGLLNLSDSFEAVIELLEPARDRSFGETMVLLFAYLSVETDEGNRKVLHLAAEMVEQAESDAARAAALAEMGKAQVRLGMAEAESNLVRALALDPHNKNACKRLAALLLGQGEAQRVVDFTGNLIAQGAGHSRLFAARVMGLALTGRMDEARALDGLSQLCHRAMLPLPEGFASLADFNRELASQLLNHPELRYERYGTASELTWRIDSPQSVHAPLVGVLLAKLREVIASHVDSLAGIDHPWLRIRPDAGKLHCWSVITDDDGYETWHVHQFGWMSGTYYVQIPDQIANGNGEGGCLAHGLPEELVGDEIARAFGQDFVRPQAGMLSLFPSHCYHRTFPHLLSERRICVAFDIWPD